MGQVGLVPNTFPSPYLNSRHVFSFIFKVPRPNLVGGLIYTLHYGQH